MSHLRTLPLRASFSCVPVVPSQKKERKKKKRVKKILE